MRGQQVYLDANFLVALSWPAHIWHTSASGLLTSFSERNTRLLLSSLALNEAIYQLMRLEERDKAENNDGEGSTSRQEWPEFLDSTLLSLPNIQTFEPPDLDFHRQVIKAVRDLKLDPTDAFHYSAARRLLCPIVTNDTGFQKIPDQNLVVVTFF